MKAVKVYGWTALVCSKAEREALGMAAHMIQARAIVAATSKAEVARIVGVRAARELFCLSETENEKEIYVARLKPGQVFASRLDGPKHYVPISAKAVK